MFPSQSVSIPNGDVFIATTLINKLTMTFCPEMVQGNLVDSATLRTLLDLYSVFQKFHLWV